MFFTFLKARRFSIESCRSSLIEQYVSELDANQDLSAGCKNNLMRTVASLMATCFKYELLQGLGVIDCSHRWKEQKVAKRAPDACIIHALDLLFFDIRNSAIPNSYRCIYFILRLISNRISEVLLMNIDCISYPDIDVYAVSIPTSKGTAYHMPCYKEHNRKLSGWCEGLMFHQ